jgi:hypothetical protein
LYANTDPFPAIGSEMEPYGSSGAHFNAMGCRPIQVTDARVCLIDHELGLSSDPRTLLDRHAHVATCEKSPTEVLDRSSDCVQSFLTYEVGVLDKYNFASSDPKIGNCSFKCHSSSELETVSQCLFLVLVREQSDPPPRQDPTTYRGQP